MTALAADRDGRLLLLAQAVDSLAGAVAAVALPWLVLDAGASEGVAGLVATLSIFPYVVAGLPSGVLADRVPRRALIRRSHVAQAGVALLIPLAAALAGHAPLAVVIAVALGIGALRAVVDAAIFAALATIAGPEDFPRSQALLSTAWAAGMVAGPFAAATLIGLVGPADAFLAEAAIFLLGAALVVAVRRPLPPYAAVRGLAPVAAIREGLAFMVRHPIVRNYTAVNSAWHLGAFGTVVLIVPLLREQVGLDATQAGWVLAAGAAAGLATVPALAVLSRILSPPATMALGIAASAVAALVLGLAHGLVPALLAYTLRGLVDAVLIAIFIGERQRHAPAELQARTGMTGRMLAVVAMSSGGFLASALAGPLGLRDVYLLMAACAALTAAVGGPLLLRATRRAHAAAA